MTGRSAAGATHACDSSTESALKGYRCGDLNCDALVNTFDIDPLLLAITDTREYETAYPACSRLLADLNADGVVNEGDIDAFVEVLTGG